MAAAAGSLNGLLAGAAPSSDARDGAFFCENGKQVLHASGGFLSRTKDLCRNASMAVSAFIGAPVKRVFRATSLGYKGNNAPWILAQSVSNQSSSSNSKSISNSKKAEVAPSAANELQESPSAAPESPSKMNSLMCDVSTLIKLVNARDIVELELKHKDFELLIRKKEALPAPPTPPAPPQFLPDPRFMTPTPFPSVPQEPPLPFPPPGPSAPPTEEVKAAEHTSPKQDVPSMLSPMAGTFYRSSAPGEPAFVKVGDKVQKGQVVCIVEAMKLMNEIEADQSGTIVEIVAEDGKAVAIDTPLFVIKP